MKKVFIAFLFITGIMTAKAQIKSTDSSLLKNKAGSPTQLAKPPAAANLQHKLEVASAKPDLVIQNLSVVYNGQSHMLNIGYTIKNIGTAAVNLGKVSMQGYISSASENNFQSACGAAAYTLLIPKDLKPGESYTASFNCSRTGLVLGTTYRYELRTEILSPPVVEELAVTNNKTSILFNL